MGADPQQVSEGRGIGWEGLRHAGRSVHAATAWPAQTSCLRWCVRSFLELKNVHFELDDLQLLCNSLLTAVLSSTHDLEAQVRLCASRKALFHTGLERTGVSVSTHCGTMHSALYCIARAAEPSEPWHLFQGPHVLSHTPGKLVIDHLRCCMPARSWLPDQVRCADALMSALRQRKKELQLSVDWRQVYGLIRTTVADAKPQIPGEGSARGSGRGGLGAKWE